MKITNESKFVLELDQEELNALSYTLSYVRGEEEEAVELFGSSFNIEKVKELDDLLDEHFKLL